MRILCVLNLCVLNLCVLNLCVLNSWARIEGSASGFVQSTDRIIQFVDDTHDPVEHNRLMALAETGIRQHLGRLDRRDRRFLQLHVDRNGAIGVSSATRHRLVASLA
jgi:hypothetical protein